MAESKPVVLHKSRIAVTVTFMLVVVAIVEMPPAGVAIASLFCVIATRPEGRWQEPAKLIFNAAQYSLAGALAALAYRGLGGVSTIEATTLPIQLLAIAVSTGVYFLINSAAVSGAVALSTRASFRATWLSSHGWLTPTYVAFGASGLLLASLYQAVGMFALPLLFVPLLVARAAFRSYQEVSEAYESTVLALVTAIEAKDAYTRGHSQRVATFARMIAEEVGMRDPDIEVFYYGALLHDVGKLAVRKAILTKPSSLEADEYEEIKRHPVLGAQIVREIDWLTHAVDMVLSHHERLDGSGYPAGLSGELVSRAARVMAVADTYDAMTSTRAYRGAATNEEALAELRRFSGTLFDPGIVEAFGRLIEKEPAAQTRQIYETQVLPHAAG